MDDVRRCFGFVCTRCRGGDDGRLRGIGRARTHNDRRRRVRHGAVTLLLRVEKAEGDGRQFFGVGVLGDDCLLEGFDAAQTELVGRFHLGNGRIDLEVAPFVQRRQHERFNRAVAADLNR